MATEFWYNDAGTFRKMKEVWYNDAGTWRKAKEVWYNDAGTWRKVFVGATPFLVSRTVSTQGDAVNSATANSGITLASNGALIITSRRILDGLTFGGNTEIVGQWLTSTGSGLGSDYEAFVAVNSGTLDSGTTGAWLSLSTDRLWYVYVSRFGNGTTVQEANISITIRASANPSVNLVTATANLHANVSVNDL